MKQDKSFANFTVQIVRRSVLPLLCHAARGWRVEGRTQNKLKGLNCKFISLIFDIFVDCNI